MKRDEKGGKCKKWFKNSSESTEFLILSYVRGTITNSGSNI